MREYKVWVQPWTKYEWNGHEFVGTPDGFSVHLEKEHAVYFGKIHKDNLPALMPTKYSLPNGNVSLVGVTEQIYEQIPKNGFGARFDKLSSPSGSPVWVIRQKP